MPAKSTQPRLTDHILETRTITEQGGICPFPNQRDHPRAVVLLHERLASLQVGESETFSIRTSRATTPTVCLSTKEFGELSGTSAPDIRVPRQKRKGEIVNRDRTGNVVLEPLPVTALTAEEARAHMAVLEKLVKREGFDKRNAVTVRCYNNELMTREYARELFRLITEEYGVPRARFISPTPDGAAHLFDAAADAGRSDALAVFTVDDARTGVNCKSLEQYLSVLGY